MYDRIGFGLEVEQLRLDGGLIREAINRSSEAITEAITEVKQLRVDRGLRRIDGALSANQGPSRSIRDHHLSRIHSAECCRHLKPLARALETARRLLQSRMLHNALFTAVGPLTNRAGLAGQVARRARQPQQTRFLWSDSRRECVEGAAETPTLREVGGAISGAMSGAISGAMRGAISRAMSGAISRAMRGANSEAQFGGYSCEHLPTLAYLDRSPASPRGRWRHQPISTPRDPSAS